MTKENYVPPKVGRWFWLKMAIKELIQHGKTDYNILKIIFLGGN